MTLRRYFGKISPLQINQLLGHDGEFVIDETTKKIYFMDGKTYGGYELANAQANLNLEFTNVNPAINNLYTLGNAGSLWANLYTQDANILGNLYIEGNINPTDTQGNNRGNLSLTAHQLTSYNMNVQNNFVSFGNLTVYNNITAFKQIMSDGLIANIISANNFIEINPSDYSGFTFTGTGVSGLLHANLNSQNAIIIAANGSTSLTTFPNGYNTLGGNLTTIYGNIILGGNTTVYGSNFNLPYNTQVGLPISFNPANAKFTYGDYVNNYTQFMLQNQSNGSNASGDIVVTADNGTDSTHYIDMGINSSTFNGGGGLDAADDGYLLVEGGKLVIMTIDQPNDIVFAVGGDSPSNEVVRFQSTQSKFTGNLIPSSNIAYSLGSATNMWKDLYLSNSSIYMNGIPLQYNGTALTINGQVLGNSAVSSYLSQNPTTTFTNISSTGNLTVQGNLIVNGTATTVNTQNLIINDNIIYVANANPSNSLDIGFAGHFTAGVYQHTGLVRQASSNVWKLFSNVAAEPTNTIDFTNAIYDSLQTGALISPTITDIYNNLSSLTSNASTQAANLATLTTNAASQTNDISTLYSNAATQAANLASLASNAAFQEGEISSLNANLAAANVNINTLFTNAAIQAANLASLTSNASFQESEISSHTTNLAGIVGGTTTLANVITTGGLYWSNGVSALTSTYGNTQVSAFYVANTVATSNVQILNNGNIRLPTGGTINEAAGSGWITLNPNISVNALAGVAIGGYGYIGTPSARVATVGYNNEAGTFGVQTNLYVGTSGTYGNLIMPQGNLTIGTGARTGNIIANGAITANFLYGNGYYITGLPASYGNTQVAAYLPTFTGTVQAAYLQSPGATDLTLLPATATGTRSYGNFVPQFSNTYNSGSTSLYWANTYTSNLNVATGVYTPKVQFTLGGASILEDNALDLLISGKYQVSIKGNGVYQYTFGNDGSLTGPTSAIAYANGAIYGNVIGTGFYFSNGVPFTSSSYGNTQVAAYLPTYAGNSNAAFFTGNGYYLTGITTGSTYSNSNVAGYILGNITVGNIITSSGGQLNGYLTGAIGANGANSGTFTTITSTGDIFVNNGNIRTSGTTGNLFNFTATTINIGNNATSINMGSSTANITIAGNAVVNGSLYTNNHLYANGVPYAGTYSNSNVASYLPTYTGNVGAGNLIGTSANVTITSGANVWTFDNTGNITLPNLSTVYINGGNVNGNIVVDPLGTGAFNVGGNIAAVGSGYFVGNGYFLTGITSGSTYSNSNVAGYILGNLTYGNIGVSGVAATANISAAYFVGNGAGLTGITANNTGNIYGTSSNVTIVAGSYSSIFNNLGNVIVPTIYSTGNLVTTNGVFYPNGTAYSSGGSTYSNSNVAAYLPTYSGNITAGNITATQYGNSIGTTATYSGNVTGGFFVGNGYYLTGVTANTAANIVGTSANVTLQAGTYSWTFDNTGNLTLPNNNYITSVGNSNITVSPGGIGSLYVTSVTPAVFANTYNSTSYNTGAVVVAGGMGVGGNVMAYGTVTSYGNNNATAFAVQGAGAVSNVALGFFPPGGTAAQMAIRDYSTVSSIMYFDTTIGSNATGGSFQFRGSNAFTQYAQINQYGINLPTRPAFRVNGTGSAVQTTSNVNLKGSILSVAFNQGNYFNSTTGVFTAPVAGIYQVSLAARVGTYNGLNQIAVFKNGQTSAGNVVCFWETDTNAGVATHFTAAGTVQLAVNDFLTANIQAGNITFDNNDNWCVTYIG